MLWWNVIHKFTCLIDTVKNMFSSNNHIIFNTTHDNMMHSLWQLNVENFLLWLTVLDSWKPFPNANKRVTEWVVSDFGCSQNIQYLHQLLTLHLAQFISDWMYSFIWPNSLFFNSQAHSYSGKWLVMLGLFMYKIHMTNSYTLSRNEYQFNKSMSFIHSPS